MQLSLCTAGPLARIGRRLANDAVEPTRAFAALEAEANQPSLDPPETKQSCSVQFTRRDTWPPDIDEHLMPNEPDDRASMQGQLVALAWVRGEVGLTEVAHAYGLPETSTREIWDRLTQGLKAWLLQQEGKNVIGLDAQTGSRHSPAHQ
jgi:hypothetical protein